jgi:hypothetical protein
MYYHIDSVLKVVQVVLLLNIFAILVTGLLVVLRVSFMICKPKHVKIPVQVALLISPEIVCLKVLIVKAKNSVL